MSPIFWEDDNTRTANPMLTLIAFLLLVAGATFIGAAILLPEVLR